MSKVRRYLALSAATAMLAVGGATGTAAAASPAAAAPQPQAVAAQGEMSTLANAEFQRGTAFCKNMALTSGDGRTLLRLQEDGNLVVYRDGRPVWQADGAWGRGNCAIFQDDGNFVLYDSNGRPVWASDTWNRGQTLVVQDDGNVVIYDRRGDPIWHTNTARPRS